MADPDKPTDIDRLLAEVENSLGGKPQDRTPARARESRAARSGSDPSWRARMGSRTRTAAISGAVAAAAVWILFGALPFFGAWSGAAGAFLAVFGTVLLLRGT